jgi:tetratricopeptide (TPR) repeat protein
MRTSFKMCAIAVAYIASLSVCNPSCFAQDKTPSQDAAAKTKELRRLLGPKDSVTVAATYTPEETEDWKINGVYQPVYALEQKGDCEAAIQRYKSEVIPLAEQAKFEVPKNKFFFLAVHGIGNCYLKQKLYEQAEQSLQASLTYLPIWPGTDDSEYPLTFRMIAMAQMGLLHWEAAEESLKKSIALFDPQIERMKQDDNDFTRMHSGNLHGWKAKSLTYLAVVYVRQERTPDALKTAELAYAEATQPNVPAAYLDEVVKTGRKIALMSWDLDAVAKWSQREPSQK